MGYGQGCGSEMICFGSDPGTGSTFKKVSAPTPDLTPDPDPVSDPATLVSASKELLGNLALLSFNYDEI
jgi:hypothetical protein